MMKRLLLATAVACAVACGTPKPTPTMSAHDAEFERSLWFTTTFGMDASAKEMRRVKRLVPGASHVALFRAIHCADAPEDPEWLRRRVALYEADVTEAEEDDLAWASAWRELLLHHPEDPCIASMVPLRLPESQAWALRATLDALVAKPDCHPRVLAHYASWMEFKDRVKARSLIAILVEREPENAEWRALEGYSHMWERGILDHRRDPRAAAAAGRAQASYEAALGRSSDGAQRLALLGKAAEAAALVGDLAAAERHGLEALAGGASDGATLQRAHRALGLVALSRGDVAAATAALMHDSKPTDRLYGTKVSRIELASAMLAAGHREPVIAYLQAHRQMHPTHYDALIAAIAAGENPELPW